MSKKIRSTNAKIIASFLGGVFIIIVVAGALFFTGSPPVTYPNYGSATTFNLVNQNNQTVTLANYAGKTLVIDFIYTHCPDNPDGSPGECSTETLKMNTALGTLQKEGFTSSQFHFVSISFDWKFDNVSTMKTYGQNRGEGQFSYWSFLSGNETQVHNVTAGYGVYAVYASDYYNSTTNTTTTTTSTSTNNTTTMHESMIHESVLWVIDNHGIRRALYTGTSWKASNLANDVANLIKDY